jgi:hypothetical protein
MEVLDNYTINGQNKHENVDKRGRKKLDQSIIIQRFEKIKLLMADGCTREMSCKKLGIGRSWIYRNLSKIQKTELDKIYFSHTSGAKAYYAHNK